MFMAVVTYTVCLYIQYSSILSYLHRHVNQLTLGVDIHLETHVAVLINNLGQVIDTDEFSVCTIGYEKLLKWSCS